MSDYTLFVAAPYIAGLSLLVLSAVRCASGVPRQPRGDEPDRAYRCVGRVVTAVAVAAVIAGHAAILAAPSAVLRWTRTPARLLLLESAGLCFGVVCLAAVSCAIARYVREAANCTCRRLPELIASMFIAVGVVSGVVVAVAYRWASEWAAVTLTPYAVSLIHLTPRVDLVAATPFVVRLHVFCSFVVAALLPFTAIGASMVIVARRAAEAGTRRLSIALTVPRAAVSDLVRRTVGPGAMSREEED